MRGQDGSESPDIIDVYGARQQRLYQGKWLIGKSMGEKEGEVSLPVGARATI
jgi:hypothetical protein